jgi:hypothetical protein
LLRLGDFGATSTLDLTPASGAYRAERPHQDFVVLADRNAHLKRTEHPDEEAGQADFLLREGVYVQVSVPPGDYLAFVVAEGEPDGLIRITPVT